MERVERKIKRKSGGGTKTREWGDLSPGRSAKRKKGRLPPYHRKAGKSQRKYHLQKRCAKGKSPKAREIQETRLGKLFNQDGKKKVFSPDGENAPEPEGKKPRLRTPGQVIGSTFGSGIGEGKGTKKKGSGLGGVRGKADKVYLKGGGEITY